jgi:uncharacterized protein (DUF433 family)
MTPEDIMKAYPELEREDITHALKYAAWLSSEKVKFIPLKGVAGA